MGREGNWRFEWKTNEKFYFFLLTYGFYLSDYLFCISKRTSSRTINSRFCVFQGIYSKWLCDAARTPPPFLFTYEKVRYHIAWLKKRFFFDNLYARMITSILVFLITETGLLQLVFRFFTSLQGNRGQFSSEFIASPPHVPCASTVPSKDLAFVTLIGPAYEKILGFLLCSLQNMR